MNQEIYRESINQKFSKVEIVEDRLEITKKDGTKIVIEDYHDQDCCERVYADFDSIRSQLPDLINDKNIKDFVIKGVPENGFLLCFYYDWEDSEKIFVPCYNNQDGYYSSKLILMVNDKRIDISEFV